MNFMVLGVLFTVFVTSKGWLDNQFLCSDGIQTVPLRAACDGIFHCADGSDERADVCQFDSCWTRRWFRCQGGGCIPVARRCDGRADCWDASDELYCPVRPGLCRFAEWKCRDNAMCIEQKAVCNGTAECLDGSDETSDACGTKFRCPESSFRCNYGACVPRIAVCDGVKHCADGSDESPQHCGCKVPKVTAPLEVKVPNCDQPDFCTQVPEFGVVQFLCNAPEYQLIGEPYSFCVSKQWSPPVAPKCIPTSMISSRGTKCPGFDSTMPQMIATCEDGARNATSCDEAQEPGNKIVFHCVQNSKQKSEAVCGLDGTWSSSPLICVPSCGIAPRGGLGLAWGPLIVNGMEASPGQWPWHAALYFFREELQDANAWRYLCGGTLVSDTAVITAGHCVYKRKVDKLLIILGKYYRLYNVTEPDTQIVKIREVLLPEAYLDSLNAYDSDLALLVLAEKVKFGPRIAPACLDWHRAMVNKHLAKNSTGVLAGWGITETDQQAEVLRYAQLKYVSLNECVIRVPSDFKKYIRTSTFCATGVKNGTSACNGDSGGGLMFMSAGAWTLQGVVSLSLRRTSSEICDPNFPTVFTRVASYYEILIPWLHRLAHTWIQQA